jgi:hypothetical protein
MKCSLSYKKSVRNAVISFENLTVFECFEYFGMILTRTQRLAFRACDIRDMRNILKSCDFTLSDNCNFSLSAISSNRLSATKIYSTIFENYFDATSVTNRL